MPNNKMDMAEMATNLEAAAGFLRRFEKALQPSTRRGFATITHAGDVKGANRSRNNTSLGQAALTTAKVRRIRNLYDTSNWSHVELAEKFDVSTATIGMALRGQGAYADI